MMKPITENDINILFTEEQIREKIKEIAARLNECYKNSNVYVICVLKGSIMFTVDLIRYLKMPLRTEFIKLSSYGTNFTSTGRVSAVDISLPDLNNQNVLIVEDIIDTGHTAQFLTDFIRHNFKIASMMFISLLDKRCKRVVDINPDMYGFTVEDKFLVGYGLDYDGYYRNLSYIGYVNIKPEE